MKTGRGIYLETDRLVLRDHIMADLSDYQSWFTNPTVMRYVAFAMPQSRREMRRFLKQIVKESRGDDRKRWYLAATLNTTKAYIGDIGFTVKSRNNNGGIADLGYFLLPEYWAKGFASEAVRRVIAFGFDELGLHRITAGCDAENHASQRVMERCGMIHEGTLRRHRYREGSWRDGLKYAILREEWESREI